MAWLRLLFITLLVIGIFFRFVNLDRKVYWEDESYASLRISGYTEVEVLQQVFNGREIGIKDLQKYKHINPEKSLIDTIKSLATEDPQHPPLYYVMARFWTQWFGNSVETKRSLSALISLLAFPCIYWLCQELFNSPLTGWMAIALIAVSPFHLLYAQEVREYGLWTVTILLSSAALLRAIRLQTNFSWWIYAASVALGLYSYLSSGLVVIGYGIYVVAVEGFRLSKAVTGYLLASFTGLLAFAPWLLVVMTNLNQIQSTTRWTNEKLPLLALLKEWALNLSRVFLDLNNRSGFKVTFTNLIIALLVGYAFYFLYRKAPKRAWLFILTLMGVTGMVLVLPDLFFGGHRSTITRYLIPCYLSAELAVTYLLATQITFIVNTWKQKLWQIIMSMLVTAGVLSCATSSQAETWWNKGPTNSYYQAANSINQVTHPLVISDAGVGNILSLTYLLDTKVRLQLVPVCYTCPINSPLAVKLNSPVAIQQNLPKVSPSFSDIFLFDSSEALRQEFEKDRKYKISLVPNSKSLLWRLKKYG